MEKRNFISNWIDSVVSKCTRIPYACVAHDPERYQKNNGRFKIVRKYLHKVFMLFLFGQRKLERNLAPKNKRILWLYTAKRNFGDANMELSGRALLKNRGISIDLLTLPNLLKLFGEDDIFENVYADIKDLEPRKYEFIVLSEFNYRSIRLKIKHFRKLPFACIFGFFDGPARNQTCFSFAGVNSFFNLELTQADIADIAKPYVSASKDTINSARKFIPSEAYIAISVGGIDSYRSYRLWPEFIQLYDKQTVQAFPKKIILLGSENGLDMSRRITAENYINVNIESQVGELSILQTRELITSAIAFVGCDGGLFTLLIPQILPRSRCSATESHTNFGSPNNAIRYRCKALEKTA